MAIVVGYGEHFNILAGAEARAVSSEDTLFPKENAVDLDQSVLFAFNAAAADDTFDADLNRVLNGDMEDWTLTTYPDNWEDRSAGTGALSEEITITQGGSSALKLTSGGSSNEATAVYLLEVVSGWAMTFSGYIRGDASVATTVKIRNIHTGKYLDSSGDWQTSATFGTQTAASYAQQTQSFTVEPYSTTLRHKCTLEIEVETASSGVGYADSFACWPHWDFASVHGHNLGVNMVPTFQSDDNSSFSSATTRATGTVAYPSFFKEPAAIVTERYFRALFTGTNHAAIQIGQIVLMQQTELTPERFAAIQDREYMRLGQREVRSSAGQIYRRNQSGDDSVVFPLTFKVLSLSDVNELLDMMRRGGNGALPAVLVPDDTEAEVFFGHFVGGAKVKEHDIGGLYDLKLEFEEEGFAVEVM